MFLKMGLSFLAATISYELIELPALRLKRRFQATEALPAADSIASTGLEPMN